MIIQGSPEWHATRCGKATASRMADITARTKSGWGASRANYAAELIAERLTGVVAPSFTNAAMQWGSDTEPQARDAYAHRFGVEVVQTSFVDHPEIAMSGASPDGLVGSAGLLEVKCPATATHLETLITGAIPDKYLKQMAWQIACCGREWCDYASFDPRLPPPMQLFTKRVHRDDSLILGLESDVSAFLAEIDETVATLRAKYEQAEAA